jgi:hypothetical protein
VTDRREAAQNNKHLKRKIAKEKIKRLVTEGGGLRYRPKQSKLTRLIENADWTRESYAISGHKKIKQSKTCKI